MATTNETLADALVRLRHTAGRSIRQLQEETGIDRSLISRIESGEVVKPGPSTLNRLARALGVPATELFTLVGYTVTEAEALPAIRPYLRSKYGHLSETAQAELATFLDRLEAEESTKRAGGQKSK
jgi:transcriptional regulator with XRE-family HTH domain